MKAHDLARALLAGPDEVVILQKDAEGNGYSPLEGIDIDAKYLADSTYSGEVYDTTWSAEDADMEPSDWEDFLVNTPSCVVLYPVN